MIYTQVLNRGGLGISSTDRLRGGQDRPPKLATFVGQNSLDRLG
ncbi:hypothetical protein [Candidatus Methylomirabilis sp.]